MAQMNEMMLNELREKAEGMVNDLGALSKSLLRNAEVHEELLKIARKVASTETSVTSTFQMLSILNEASRELNQSLNQTQTNMEKLDDVCALFLETEKVYTNSVRHHSNASDQ